MTSPTMPTPSTPMQTLIRWRDAKTEMPRRKSTEWKFLIRFASGEISEASYFLDSQEFEIDGYKKLPTHWAYPEDIQNGEFVSVEAIKGLPTYDLVEYPCRAYNSHLIEKVNGGRFVRLSDIEQLGKGG